LQTQSQGLGETLTHFWKPGQSVALRGIVGGRTWFAQSVIVVKDTIEESALLLLPGAQCAGPEGYFRRKAGDYSLGTRWQEAKRGAWTLRAFAWQTNRFLILLEPDQYYATFYIWNHSTDDFQCYYVNFQLPYQRSECGFDTFDLDLDLVIEASLDWRWKDEAVYQDAIREGGVQPNWMNGIAQAQERVLAAIGNRQYPFDGTWLQWRPDPTWQPSSLPAGWQNIPGTSMSAP
jgi:hypothetical protein